MPNSILNLWPEDIKIDVVTPIAILQGQKEQLSLLTKNILQAEILPNQRKDKRISLQFDVIAPTLDYRHRLLTAIHDQMLVYPVSVS